MNISIVKILKHIEDKVNDSSMFGNDNIDNNYIDGIMNDAHTFEDFYHMVEGFSIVSGSDNIDRLIATFCINWKLCSGDWDRFISGELKLENPKKQEYNIENTYIASVARSEYGYIDSYLPSSALWSAMEYEIDMSVEDEEILEVWDNNWEIV
jgi:hypothetical protein